MEKHNVDFTLFALLGNISLEEVMKKVEEMKEHLPIGYVPDIASLKNYEQYGVEVKFGNLYFMGKSVEALSTDYFSCRVNFLNCNGKKYNGYKMRVMDYKLVALLGLLPVFWKRDPEDKYAMVYCYE